MFARLLRWWRGSESTGSSAAERAAGRAAATPAGFEAKAAAPGLHRRPLVDRRGQVAAFELRPAATEPPTPAGGLGLLAQAIALASEARPALVAWPALAGSLAELPPAQGAAPGLWLTLRERPPGPHPEAEAWRQHGARVGVRDRPPEACGDVDFVHLRAAAGGLDTLRLAAQRWQETRPGVAIVATGLDTLEDVERMLKAGVRYAGGRLDRSAQALPPRPLQPAAHRICTLLNDLALNRDTGHIAEGIRGDLNLAWRLLRVVNSPALGLARQIESVDQAVMLLGREEMRRWLGVLLLSAGEGRPAAPALQASALARGRLLELLAPRDTRASANTAGATPAALFTLGLFANLHLLLQVPVASAIGPLRLAEPLHNALVAGQGPLAHCAHLLDVLDGDDDAALAEAAAPWGGRAVVSEALRAAWDWAEGAAIAAQ